MKSKMVFTYGMLISSAVMRLCSNSARVVELGLLPEHRLIFNNHATVVAHESHYVYGVIWMIDQDELAKLDQIEGYPDYYTRELMWIYGTKGTWRCWVYIMKQTAPEIAPDPQYLEYLKYLKYVKFHIFQIS